MISLLQQPDALSLSGNMKPFIFMASEPVHFRLNDGTGDVIDETYYPGQGNRIVIQLQEIIETRLSTALPGTDIFTQSGLVKDFTAAFGNSSYAFRVIRAGVDDFANTASNFLRANFLTWQPQRKDVTYYSPEYLTYYAAEDIVFKVEAHFADGTVQTVTPYSATQGEGAVTVNMQYALIAQQLGNSYPSSFDVWVENTGGTRLTFVQRYVLAEPRSRWEQYFLFVNSLGGIDSFTACGEGTLTPQYTPNIADMTDYGVPERDMRSIEYRTDALRWHTHNTGRLSLREAAWLQDFFTAPEKWVHTVTSLRPIVLDASNPAMRPSELPAYEFTWRYAKNKPYLNIPRVDPLPETLLMPSDVEPLAYLPPRLAEFPIHMPDADLLSPSMTLTTTVGVQYLFKRSTTQYTTASSAIFPTRLPVCRPARAEEGAATVSGLSSKRSKQSNPTIPP
jgi:hypothetical protein